MCRILGVCGSLRSGSHTRKIVELVLKSAHEAGAETHLLDLGEVVLPLYNPDAPQASANEERVGELVTWAEGFVLGSPDYHGSMSGSIANFLDYFWEEFAGKLFGHVVASHEKGLTVMEQMRTAVRQCYGWSLPYGIGANGDECFNAQGIADAKLAKRVRMMGHDLQKYGTLIYGQFKADLAKSPRDPSFSERYQL